MFNGVREIFRRPSPQVLKGKEQTLVNLRSNKARADKLATLLLCEGWPEFIEILNESVHASENALKDIQSRKFLLPQELEKRALLMERKETYERIRTLVDNFVDQRKTLEDQIAETQADVMAYRERLGS